MRAFDRCAPLRGGCKADDQSNGPSRHLAEITFNQAAQEDCLIAA